MISKVSARKILHDYAIPIFATILLVIIFLALWIFHQYALASVSNLATTNPLIVSDANKLVSRDKTADPDIEQSGSLTDGTTNGETDSPSDTSSDNKAPQTPTSNNKQQPIKPSGGSTSGAGNPTTPTTPSTPTPQFTVSLGTIEYSRTRSNIVTGLFGLLLGCTIDHHFKITVNGLNGPGTLKYRWVRSTGGGGDLEQKALSAGNTSIELAHNWTTSSSGDYWVNLEVTAPINTEKKYTFKHSC
jgi:hypothetical protein